jgi:hypothetical protein
VRGERLSRQDLERLMVRQRSLPEFVEDGVH